MRLIKLVIYLIVILIGVSFAALNASTEQLNLYFTTIAMPISALILIAMALGVLLGSLLILFKYLQLKVKYIKACNQLKLTEKEIINLREIPLKNKH